MSSRWNARTRAWARFAVSAVLVGSFAVMAENSASANSAVLLYAASPTQGTASCLDVADACDLQSAITLVDGYTNTDATIDVAPGQYVGHYTINLPTSDTLTIQGAAPNTAIISGSFDGTDLTIGTRTNVGAGGPVTIIDINMGDGVAEGQVMSGNPDGNAAGGGIDNLGGDLTVEGSLLSQDDVIAGSPFISPGGNAYGGALYDASGTLILDNDIFSTDKAFAGAGGMSDAGGSAAGGAVYVAAGTVSGQNDLFDQDDASGGSGGNDAGVGGQSHGGAVFSDATMTTFLATTFSNDEATGGNGGADTGQGVSGGDGNNAYGGALDNEGSTGSTVLTQDTFSSDEATGGNGGSGGANSTPSVGGSAYGGGFYNNGGVTATATLTDDTFTQDAANASGFIAFGGAIDNTSSTTSVLFNTIANNSVSSGGAFAGAGVYNASGSVSVANSILDQSSGTCGGTISDGGYNVATDTTCDFATSEEAYTDGEIGLASLAYSGPGAQTMAIGSTSAAFEEVPTANCTYAADERGEARPGVTGAYCDAGAYEWQGSRVTYDANGGSGAPTDTNTYAPNENVNVLFSSMPTRSGYGFGGWCTMQEPVDTACQALDLYPNQNFPVTGLTMGTADVTLYALWYTPRTLYVNANDHGSTCADATTDACPTIQDAINQAQDFFNDAVTIDVAPGTYDENDEIDLVNNDTLDIVGAGASATTIDGGDNGTDFKVDFGLVTIEGLTIQNGEGYSNGGGGIRNDGAVIATNDTFSGNHGEFGGAIFNDGTLLAANDTFTDNEAGGYGGAIDNPNDGYLVATNDTFLSNQAAISGGAIYNDSEETLAQEGPNSSFFTFYANATILTNDTFSDDTAVNGGDALGNQGSPVTISNSVLDEIDSCYGSFPSSPDGGYNVESDDTCDFTGTSEFSNSAINLAGSLGANGSSGPETLAIDPTSSAFQEVPSVDCTLTTDERGNARPSAGSNCDAGAFEYAATPFISPPAPTTTTTTTAPADTLSFASDGGSSVSNVSGTNGASVTLPAAPRFAGHRFEGWFTQTRSGTLAGLAGATYTLTSSLTLFAHWSTKSVSPSKLVLLGTVHTFTLGSSALSSQLQNQVKVYEKVILAEHYVDVSLRGEATLPVTTANRALAFARAKSVEAYLQELGLKQVHYTLSESVTGTTSASMVVVVASR